MTHEKHTNLQDVFLNKVRKEKMEMTIFLVNGIKLQGVITWFDNFAILLRREEKAQLVYKHSVATMLPVDNMVLYEQEQLS